MFVATTASLANAPYTPFLALLNAAKVTVKLVAAVVFWLTANWTTGADKSTLIASSTLMIAVSCTCAAKSAVSTPAVGLALEP